MPDAISRADVPARPVIGDLNSLLEDIHVRHIALKREDCQRHYRVFREVFHQLNANMRAADAYYRRYCSTIQFAGSHYDRLRIKKPDVFYMEIVIDVPVNMHTDPVYPDESDIVIKQSGFGLVTLRAGTQYKKILIGDGQDCLINRAANEWLDDRSSYILRSKFTNWFRGVGYRGLNLFETLDDRPVHYVDGVAYTIHTITRGPAWTIIIVASGFRLDVDLVPALKFPKHRWLEGNRPIPPECHGDYWMVVPKVNKDGLWINYYEQWRVALQDQEQQLLNKTYHLRQIMRLLEKLRDSQGMHGIANYYIKTLFLWEVDEKKNTDPTFWQRNDVATLFKHMLKKFCEALKKRSIPYFWNKSYNMIVNLNTSTFNEYKGKVDGLLSVLEDPSDYSSVARYMLTSDSEEYIYQDQQIL